MSGLRVAVEDRKADAVAHLAVARSQNTGPAFWGLRKIKAVVLYGRFFLLRKHSAWRIGGAACAAEGSRLSGQAEKMILEIIKEFSNE